MINLNYNQTEFLLKFFENSMYPGWKNIATILLEKGKCVVAGTSCIWKGGIGNFINISISDDLIDCVIYEFDIDYFMTSNLYMEKLDEYLLETINMKNEALKKYYDILTLKK